MLLAALLGALQPASNDPLVRGRLRFAGSETMAPLLARWADAFARRQPAAVLQIEGRGSESAIRALLSGTADVAALSRPLSPEESAALRARFGEFRVVEVGRDSLRLAARIGGAAWLDPARAPSAFGRNLSDLRGVGRLPGSGTRLEALGMLGLARPVDGTFGLVSPVAVQLALRSDPGLVGYASPAAGLSDVRALPGPGLARTLCLVVPGRNPSNPVVARFLAFLATPEGRGIVVASGFSAADSPP